jgi:maltose O-acetyltransferase
MLKRLIVKICFRNKNNKTILKLKKIGVSIGENCYFFDPNSCCIDTQRPHMLHIGNMVYITHGVTILTHDYSRVVLSNMEEYGNVGEAGYTWIGDNVFIGMNSTVLMGCHIGNNSIVGVNSVCTGEYPDNSVIAGNPARVICSIEEFYHKRKKHEIDAAKEFIERFQELYGRLPDSYEMTDAFSWIYTPRDDKSRTMYSDLLNLNNKKKENAFLKTQNEYKSFQEFLDDEILPNIRK